MRPTTYEIAPDGGSITCRVCSMTSYNRNDVEELYCACCHRFHEHGVLMELSHGLTPPLFDLPVTLSPRMKWMRRHNARTGRLTVECDEDGEPWPTWRAWIGDLDGAVDRKQIAEGETEIDALNELAKMHGLPIW